jgi:RNA polymerase sigma factor (sigma-70 family)
VSRSVARRSPGFAPGCRSPPLRSDSLFFEFGRRKTVFKKNDGKGESNIIQNQFTAYLKVAIRNRKAQYLRNKLRILQYERYLDLMQIKEPEYEPDMLGSLPVEERIDDFELLRALRSIGERDRYIFLAKALEGRSLAAIAAEIGVGCYVASTAYYRTVRRLKKCLEAKQDGF